MTAARARGRAPRLRTLVFLALLVVAPYALASAQGGAGVLLPEDRDASAQLTQIVESTRNDGLPVDPILAKIQYGVRIAHAEPERIVASARALASRLAAARDALAPASAGDIVAGADALGSGATSDALRAVRQVSGSHPVATPLGVLAQLIESRVPVKRATEIVTDLIRRGATSEQLMALGNNVNEDVRRGVAALAALDARAKFLSGVLPPASNANALNALGPTTGGTTPPPPTGPTTPPPN